MTQYLAGPTVTRMMAEMGADIIKIEQELPQATRLATTQSLMRKVEADTLSNRTEEEKASA